MKDTTNQKNTIRNEINQKRYALSPHDRHHCAAQIVSQLLTFPPIENSNTIALYYPFKNEVDLTLLCETIPSSKTFALPVVLPNKQLAFHPYKPGDELIKNKYGIPEPNPKLTHIHPKDIEVMILPLIAFDEQGNRIGTGAGYYDRTLEFMHHHTQHKPYLIGVAYDFQKNSEITPDPWDIPLNAIITEKQIYTCGE